MTLSSVTNLSCVISLSIISSYCMYFFFGGRIADELLLVLFLVLREF